MEFDLIGRIQQRAATRADVRLGIGDDGAIVHVAHGRDLVIVADTMNVDVHFPRDTPASAIGWKSLAVNLSDLAAMGAEPTWCTLSLSLPEADTAWLDGFLDGFFALSSREGIALVGGDTTRGPLSIAVTAHGFVPPGAALTRAGAGAGDELWVTGTLGDAAAALAQWRADEDGIDGRLRERLDRPTPRIAAGIALRHRATACIDVSDGLLADLAHLLRASGVGATLHADRLPASDALRSQWPRDRRHALQLGGGDDYELCFAAPVERHESIVAALDASGTPACVIGRIDAGQGLRVIDESGEAIDARVAGWDHFRGSQP